MTKNKIPKNRNVFGTPQFISNILVSGANKTREKPNAPTIMPVANPRLSGNHFCTTDTVVV